MATIWKFKLDICDFQEIEMPIGSTILCFQMNDNIPCIWASVNEDAPRIKRSFVIVGTGNPMPTPTGVRTYIGTVQERIFVWHLFEVVDDLC